MNDQLWEIYMKVIHNVCIGDPKAWARLDLTMPQLKVLMILNAREEATVGTLAETMGVSLSNMTGILDRLVAQGLVERIPSQSDRRSILIRLTENAREIFHKLNQSGYERFHSIIEKLTMEEREIVELGLNILALAMEKESR
jgi:DNA-binding MarR family transcriptional regulator